MYCVKSDAPKRLGFAYSQTIRNKSFLPAPLCLVLIRSTGLGPLSPTVSHLYYYPCTDLQAAILHRHVLKKVKGKELTPA